MQAQAAVVELSPAGGVANVNQARALVQAPATTKPPRPDQNENPMSREDLQNLRDQIRQSIRAQLDAEAQGSADGAPRSAMAEGRPRNIVIRGSDGKETVVSVPSYDAKHLIPPQAVDISVAFFVMVAAIIIGLPIARAFARRIDRNTSRAPVAPELSAQLTQLNQAVDAIALEVERISEGQRYTTRLLSEQEGPARHTLTTPAER